MKKQNKLWGMLLLLLLFVGWVISALTMNFIILGGIIIALIGLVYGGYNYFQKKSLERSIVGKENREFALISCCFLIAIGALSLHTLDNYFYPEEKVFRNVDHHVLRLDGAKLNNPVGFVVAENSNHAFLDSYKTNGKISIEHVDTATLTLSLDKCTRALYANNYTKKNRCDKRELLNADQLLHFNDGNKGDTLFLKLSDGRVLKFYSDVMKDVDKFYKRPIKNPLSSWGIGKERFVLFDRNDSVNYYIQINDSIRMMSSEHRILTSGLPLIDILKDVDLPGVDLYGINIVRPVIYPTIPNYLKVFDYDEMGYHVEYITDKHDRTSSGNLVYVEKFYSASDRRLRSLTQVQNIDIQLKYGQSISLGHPLNSAQHIYFTKDSSNNVFIHYRQPKYAYIPSETIDKKFNSVYVATSLIDSETLQYAPEQIILFDVFEKFDNVNSINPFTLSYIAGPTTQNIKFIATSPYSEPKAISTENKPIQYIPEIASTSRGLLWNVGVENLKETSPCKIVDVKHYILFLTIALAFLILLGAVPLRKDSEEKQKRNTFTVAEFIMYAMVIYMVTFRFFLLWRVSVFPPTENVSFYEYEELFRSQGRMDVLLNGLEVFVGVIFCVKLILMHHESCINFVLSNKFLKKIYKNKIYKNITSTYSNWNEKWRNWNAMLKKKLNHSPKISPKIKEFIESKFPERIIKKVDSIREFTRIYICSKTALMFVVLFILTQAVDSPAFRIVLIVLGFIGSMAYDNYRFLEHYKLEDQQCTFLSFKHPILKYLVAVLLNIIAYTFMLYCVDAGYMTLFLTFCVFYLIWFLHEYVTTYMSEEAYSKWRDLGVLALFILFVLLLIYYRELINFIFNYPNSYLVAIVCALGFVLLMFFIGMCILRVRITKGFGFMLVVATVFLVCGVAIVRNVLPQSQPHMVNRITVHFKNPENALSEKSTDKEMARYMDAALNHMIIGEYESRGEEVSSLGESYFKMQPHSKIGALWNAQLTDISLVRYCIAEHGKFLPFCFMLLFILMLFIAVRMPLYHRWARVVLILIPLLLVVQSLLIWMTNTLRFIFLGQDFPMLSINSKLTVYFFFSLSLFWLLMVIFEKVCFHKLYEDNEDDFDWRLENKWRYEVAHHDSYKILAISLLALVLCAFIGMETKKKENSFEVHNLMENVKNEVQNTINPLLLKYQKEHTCFKLQRNMKADIDTFNKTVNVRDYIKKNVSDTACTNLLINLWEDFVENGSANNSSSLVMHARLSKHTINRNGNDSTIYPIQMNIAVRYYDKKLPEPTSETWKGSFVTRAYSQSQEIASQYGNAQTLSIPATWIDSPLGAVIVKDNSVNYKTIVKHGTDVAYLARNVRVNGKSMFIYPLGEKFYWIRNFQEQIAAQRRNVDVDSRDEHFNDNVEMTISKELTASLYEKLANSALRRKQPSVMVANGDGEVVAMVSYDDKYQLNPNDYRTISQINDSLYMNALYGSEIERRAFANKNLVHLPAGPGSSQKPLLWTAVASAIDFPWKDLVITPYNGNILIEPESKYFIIKQFNTKKFKDKHPFKVLRSDERYGTEPVNLVNYMAYSSNVYNALMAYIGSFNDLNDINNIKNIAAVKDTANGIFAYSSYEDYTEVPKSYFVDNFPILDNSADGKPLFSLNKWPDNTTQSNSVLESQMHTMFLDDVHHTKTKLSSTAGNALANKDVVNTFAYAAISYLHNRESNNITDFVENGIRSTAIGAQAVWDITPWKMAESFGRMASLNSNYTLSVLKRPKMESYIRFTFTDGYKDARPSQMKGMGMCVSEGTAGRLRLSQNQDGDAVKIGDYYIYAKTGTSNKGSQNYHRLGVIISNRPLANANDLSSAKFYVVYFATEDGSFGTYTECLKLIINSNEFKTYMNQ